METGETRQEVTVMDKQLVGDIALYGVRELVLQMDHSGLRPRERRERMREMVDHYSLLHGLVDATTWTTASVIPGEAAGFLRAVLIPELRRRILAIPSDRGAAAAKKGAYAEVIRLIEDHIRHGQAHEGERV